MAEARLAVDPRPSCAHVGQEVDTTVKKAQLHLSSAGMVLYVPHPRFLVRSLKKKMWHATYRVQTAFLPVPTWLFAAIVGTTTYLVVTAKSNAWVRTGWLAHALWALDSYSPLTKAVMKLVGDLSTPWRVGYLTLYFSGACMLAITGLQRFLLRHVLAYHGWIHERRTKSLKTKVWGFVLKYVYIRRIAKNLTAYQGSLPTLPLPSIENTVKTYLKTMDPVLSEEEKKEAKDLGDQFLAKEGSRLQWYLRLKWLTSSNYISDWWLNYVYLRSRDPLPINSNWYGVLPDQWRPTNIQAARAASITYQMTKINYYIENETFEPQSLMGMIPLCMQQYESAFGVTRIPGREHDSLIHAEPDECRHVVVLSRGRFYKVDVISPKSNMPLSPLQLFAAFEGILNIKEDSDTPEKYLPALTAANRTEWAACREECFLSDHYNRDRLNIIEQALFVVTLDDEPGAKDASEEGRRYLVGNGCNRWCDKSFNLVVGSDGKCGVHAEHAWADAPTLAHLIELCVGQEGHQKYYNPDGTIKPTQDDLDKQKKGIFRTYPAQRIVFQVDDDLATRAKAAYDDYLKRIADLDLHSEHYDKYGKGEMKRVAKMSPDGWIQMALQLAYYRDQGRFDQTYESSMTRLFYAGRTETIRSASTASAAFVRGFEDPNLSAKEKVKLLRDATEHHQHTSHQAMIGEGVDRHLFGLYVVSAGKNIDSPFLKFALSKKWKLSTSQVPVQQCGKAYHHKDKIRWLSPNGGFGPVADDGYGVSYCVCGEEDLFFNVSGKHTASNTDCKGFAKKIVAALDEMMALVSADAAEGKK